MINSKILEMLILKFNLIHYIFWHFFIFSDNLMTLKLKFYMKLKRIQIYNNNL
jgi:hypothetical protein